MKLSSTRASIYSISLSLLVIKIHAAVVPLSSTSPDPVFSSFSNFDWSSANESVNRTFSIDVNELARAHITDLNHEGKGFSVYDNDRLVGETATVITKENSYGIEEYNFRQGFFNLDKGSHIITVQLNDPIEKGMGTIRIIPGWNKESMVVVPTLSANSSTSSILNNTTTESATDNVNGSNNLENLEQKDDSNLNHDENQETATEDIGNESENGDGNEEDEYEESEYDESEGSDSTEGDDEESNTEKYDGDNEGNYNNHSDKDQDEEEKEYDNFETDKENYQEPDSESVSIDEPYVITITSTVIVNVYQTNGGENSVATEV